VRQRLLSLHGAHVVDQGDGVEAAVPQQLALRGEGDV
tara:strand:- start:331 stop:441 length:111 start_codon:yes stop_codon:yes gene_type:complete